MLTPDVRAVQMGSCHSPAEASKDLDREMRCLVCGTRVFSSRAQAFVDSGLRCPRCRGSLELVPGPAAESLEADR